MNKIEEEKLKNTVPPENYTGQDAYPYSRNYCPGYDGYIPFCGYTQLCVSFVR